MNKICRIKRNVAFTFAALRLVFRVTIKKHDEESALLRAAAFDGGSEREYNIACELIAKKHGLTKRETEILSLLARGRDVSFICNELYLARNTVKGYTKRIYAKMNIHSKQEAIDMVLFAMSRQ